LSQEKVKASPLVEFVKFTLLKRDKIYPITGLDRPLKHHEVEASRISVESAHEGGVLLSPKYWLPLPHRRYPWFLFLSEADPALGS